MIKTENIDSSQFYPIRNPMPPTSYESNLIDNDTSNMDEKPIIQHLNSMSELSLNDDPITKQNNSFIVRNNSYRKLPSPLITSKLLSLHHQQTNLSCMSSVLSSQTTTIKYCGSSHNTGHMIDNLTSSTTPNSNHLNGRESNLMAMTTSNYTSTSSTGSVNSMASKSTQSNESAGGNSVPDTTKKSGARRPEKPPVSYINMIAKAIRESPNRQLTLNEIYLYLQKE